jgi:hypothetical protein
MIRGTLNTNKLIPTKPQSPKLLLKFKNMMITMMTKMVGPSKKKKLRSKYKRPQKNMRILSHIQ